MAKRMYSNQEGLVFIEQQYLQVHKLTKTRTKIQSSTSKVKQAQYSNESSCVEQQRRQRILIYLKEIVRSLGKKMNKKELNNIENGIQYFQNVRCDCMRSLQLKQREVSKSKIHIKDKNTTNKVNTRIKQQHSKSSSMKMSNYQTKSSQSIMKFSKVDQYTTNETNRKRYINEYKQIQKNKQREIIIECQTNRETNKIEQQSQSQYSFANRHSSQKRYRLQNLRPQLNQQMQRNDQAILSQSQNLRKQLEFSRRELQNSKRELEYTKRQLEKSKRELEDSQKKKLEYEYRQTQVNTISKQMIQNIRDKHRYSNDDQLLRILMLKAQQIQIFTAKRQI